MVNIFVYIHAEFDIILIFDEVYNMLELVGGEIDHPFIRYFIGLE